MGSEKAQKIFRRLKLDFVYIYGSVAREQMMWWSDIDFAIASPKFLDLTANQHVSLLGEIIHSID